MDLISGNEAIFRGAVRAGAGFYAGYPITPSNEIMEEAARYSAQNNKFIFHQAEDEIAAAMVVVGASMAGAKAFTATSGPGLSLMQESIGYAYMTETPLVIIDVQRVGPSTGMPTYPAQADLAAIAHGSHGDYQMLAFCPSSVEEAYRLSYRSFNAAEAIRGPVILAADGFIGHLTESADLSSVKLEKIIARERAPLGTGSRHFTGLLSKNGIPETASAEVYRQWYAGRKTQVLDAVEKYADYEYISATKKETLLVAFGITARVVSELVGEKVGLFRPIRLFPVLEKELREVALGYQQIIIVEASDGQYAGEVERVLRRPVKRIPQLGGTFSATDIAKQIDG